MSSIIPLQIFNWWVLKMAITRLRRLEHMPFTISIKANEGFRISPETAVISILPVWWKSKHDGVSFPSQLSGIMFSRGELSVRPYRFYRGVWMGTSQEIFRQLLCTFWYVNQTACQLCLDTMFSSRAANNHQLTISCMAKYANGLLVVFGITFNREMYFEIIIISAIIFWGTVFLLGGRWDDISAEKNSVERKMLMSELWWGEKKEDACTV